MSRPVIDPAYFPALIGARLRELRKSAGLTANGVARLIGSHHSVICRIDNGHHTPSIETIARYARACGYDVGDVLTCLNVTQLPGAADSQPLVPSCRGVTLAENQGDDPSPTHSLPASADLAVGCEP